MSHVVTLRGGRLEAMANEKENPTGYFFQRGQKDAKLDRPCLFKRQQDSTLVFDVGEIPQRVEEDWDPAKRIAYMAGYESAQWI